MSGPGLTVERLHEYVDVQGDCWEWTRRRDDDGYGRVTYLKVRGRQAHRVIYELLLGPIPGGLPLDHLCRNPPCCNPDHLEPVTYRENAYRSPFFKKSHCRHGHRLDAANTLISPRGWRKCRICERQRDRRRHHARKAAA